MNMFEINRIKMPGRYGYSLDCQQSYLTISHQKSIIIAKNYTKTSHVFRVRQLTLYNRVGKFSQHHLYKIILRYLKLKKKKEFIPK